MISFDGVLECVAVAETGSFTAAARRLETSVARVSRSIAALETRLSARLFHRTTRKVTITAAGRLYYEHCTQLLKELQLAETAVSALEGSPHGILSLTAPVAYGESHIAPLLNDYLVHYPKLEVRLRLTNETLDLLDENVDLAIRLGQLPNSSMIVRRLATRRQYLCASPQYTSQFGTPASIADLKTHKCLAGTLGFWRFNVSAKEVKVRIEGRLACNSGHVLLRAAIRGLGIVQLPDYYVDPMLESGQLVELLADNAPKEEGIWALFPNRQHISPKVRLLVEHLSENL